MKQLLSLQSIYLAFALGYNMVSFVLLKTTGLGLAATSPLFGLVMVALIVGPCVYIGWKGHLTFHAVYALFVAVVFCFVGGTVPHVQKYLTGDLSEYRSTASLVAAAGINFAGSIIFLCSAIKAWTLRSSRRLEIK